MAFNLHLFQCLNIKEEDLPGTLKVYAYWLLCCFNDSLNILVLKVVSNLPKDCIP